MDIKPSNPLLIENQLRDLSFYKYHPNALVNIAINRVSDITGGRVSQSDPSNPFVYILESLATFTAFGIQEDLIISKSLYASLANNEEDLHRHMSDRDFIGRFSTPAKAEVTFTLMYNDFLTKGVKDRNTGDTILTIPRNYQVNVYGYNFTVMSPIIIRRTEMGVVDVRYDNKYTDNLFPLETDYINFDVISTNNQEKYLTWKVKLPEVHLRRENINVQRGKIIDGEWAIPAGRQFYYMRVYSQMKDGSWRELIVNHVEDVWDIDKPTCTIKVIRDRGVIKYYVPQVYNKEELIGDKLRFVIYTTLGAINVNFDDFLTKPDSFVPSHNKIFPELEENLTTLPLSNITKSVYLEGKVIGGLNEKSIARLKRDVINNNLQVKIPITKIQIESALEDTGLKPILNYDVVTGREYLVKAEVPSDVSRYKVAKMSLSLMEFRTTMEDLIKDKNNMTSPKEGVIIMPQGTLFKVDPMSGVEILTRDEATRVQSLSGFDLTTELNTLNYQSLYYHYILDASTHTTKLRAYEIDKPKLLKTNFKDYNNTTGIGITTLSGLLTKNDKGFRIDYLIDMKLFDNRFNQYNIVPFLVYRGDNGNNYFLEGKLHIGVDESPVFSFYIDSEFYIDQYDDLFLTNFMDANGVSTSVPCGLTHDFDLVYMTDSYPDTFKESSMDDVIYGTYLARDNLAVVTLETHTLKFGDKLEHLFSKVHTATGVAEYMRHESNEYQRYKKTVYGKDNTIVHNVNDIVYDDLGNPVIESYKGDAVLDQSKNPIVKEGANLNRYLNLLFVDYKFEVANSLLVREYRDDVKVTLNTYLLDTLPPISKVLLDKTKIFLTVPNRKVQMLVNADGFRTLIDTAQSFRFNIYVRERVYEDQNARQGIENTVRETLNDYLINHREFVKTDLNTLIKGRVKQFATSVSLTRFTNLNSEYISIIDEDAELSVRKKLVVVAGGYGLEDDVTFNFINVDALNPKKLN